LGLLVALLASCGATPASGGGGLVAAAELTATAMLESARATVVIEAAISRATLLAEMNQDAVQTAIALGTPVPASAEAVVASTALPADNGLPTVAPTLPLTGTAEGLGNGTIQVLGVGFAADGQFINVQFTGPPQLVSPLNQLNCYVQDEATGTIYNSVPVMPVVGPLLGRPARDGQIGYVMFLNVDLGMKAGDTVTVVLGDVREEHVVVQ
jgi:hypothetical protein